MTNRIRAILTAGACIGAIAASSGTAFAGNHCGEPVLFNPLTGYGDFRDYFLAPGGDFEDEAAPGWKLTGGAAIAGGNEPKYLTGPGRGSLSLPVGATATSPKFCVDLNHPTFRFMAAQLEVGAKPTLNVDVLFTDGISKSAGSLRLASGDGWRLSDDMSLRPRYGDKLSGWRMVSLRFRSTGDRGEFRIDSLLIDPIYRN